MCSRPHAPRFPHHLALNVCGGQNIQRPLDLVVFAIANVCRKLFSREGDLLRGSRHFFRHEHQRINTLSRSKRADDRQHQQSRIAERRKKCLAAGPCIVHEQLL